MFDAEPQQEVQRTELYFRTEAAASWQRFLRCVSRGEPPQSASALLGRVGRVGVRLVVPAQDLVDRAADEDEREDGDDVRHVRDRHDERERQLDDGDEDGDRDDGIDQRFHSRLTTLREPLVDVDTERDRADGVEDLEDPKSETQHSCVSLYGG